MTQTRKIKKPGAKPINAKKVITSTKKKAKKAKNTAHIVQEAAEKLRVSHIYSTAITHSIRHDKKCKKFMGEYIVSLALSADKLGPDLLQMVPDVYGGTLPRLLIEM